MIVYSLRVIILVLNQRSLISSLACIITAVHVQPRQLHVPLIDINMTVSYQNGIASVYKLCDSKSTEDSLLFLVPFINAVVLLL